MSYILTDIGATNTRIAVAGNDLEKFSEPVMFPTPSTIEGTLELINKTGQGIGGGEIRGAVVGKPHPLWHGRDFRTELANLMGVPVVIENDTALVGLGEARYGAGKGAGIVAYITVSTGVNGARMVGGRIDQSREGFEIGGQYLSTVGTTSLEDIISGSAIQRRFGMHPKELGKEHPVWAELAQVLAYGVHNTILHWSPDIVVIGGSMMNEVGISIQEVAAHLRTIMKKFDTVPEIAHSSLHDFGGLWGGLARLQQEQRRPIASDATA